jgi:phosphoribosylanthranilate isomerase
MAKTGLPATGGDDSAARFGAASGNGHDSRVPGGDDDPDGRFGPRTSGSTMFHVKICGITTAVDALAVAAAGADAVGLNFVPGSPRCLDRDRARAVAAAVPSGVLRVGVFAGASPADMLSLAHDVGLDAIQLHGCLPGSGATGLPTEAPEVCAALAGLGVIRAVRLETAGLEPARRWLEAAGRCGRLPDLVLVDASLPRGAVAGRLGGTGATVDWDALVAAGPLPVPLALAGGLTPGNVAMAIERTGIGAVDVASGVESAPGVKDPALVRAFVAAARAARAGRRG